MARVYIKSAMIIGGLSIALMACQPYKGNQLSSDNKSSAAAVSDFDNTLKGIGRVESAAALIAGQPTIVSDPIVEQMKQSLQTANCQVSYSKDSLHSGNRDSAMTIAGANCPVLADYSASYQINDTTGKITIDTSFSIVDPQLQALNDITDLSLTGNGQYTFKGQSTTPPTESGKILAQVNGFAISKSQGKITLALVQSQDIHKVSGVLTTTGIQKIQATTSNANILLNAEIRIINGVDYSAYYLNSARITAQEYFAYLRSVGMILFN